MTNGLTIGRAARRAGVGIETIRFYERRGLIAQPARPRTGGYRLYDDEAVERIRFIRQAQELGFSLREIAELLSLRADPAADCGDVRTQAVMKREDVSRKIAQLEQMRAALDELIASCPGGGALRACTILDALTGNPGAKAGRPILPSHPSSGNAGHKRRAPKGRGMKSTTLGIKDLHCDGCARTIEALLSREPGVSAATVSFETKQARILHDPGIVSAERLAAAIREAGYAAAGRSR